MLKWIKRSVVLGLWLVTLPLMAQYGKVSGTVIDAETNRPLIGVNIIIEGTSIGTATDENGHYFLLRLRPGEYRVQASMMGYQKLIKEDVRVSLNRTTTIDFALTASAVELEAVVVQAKRPPIIQDKTHSSSYMNSEAVEDAPAEGLREMVDLVAGVARTDDGGFEVRGGPSDDLKFFVNGVEQDKSAISRPGYGNNLDNRNWLQDFNPLAVGEMEIIIGGFNAEYGKSQSGLVNIVTKEGGSNFNGKLNFEYGPPGQYHWGHYLYDKEKCVEWQNWGSFDQWEEWNNSLVEANRLTPDSLHFMHNQWVDNHTPGSDHLGGAYDYRKLAYMRTLFSFGGPLGNYMNFFFAGESRKQPTRLPTFQQYNVYQNYSLTLSLPLSPYHKLLFTGQYAHSDAGNAGTYQGDIRHAGRAGNFKYALQRENGRDEYVTSQSVKWTHTLSKRSYYDILINHNREIARTDPIMISGANNPWWIEGGQWDEGYLKNNMGRSAYSEDSRVDVWEINSHFESQINRKNLIKTGLNLKYWDLFVEGESLGPSRWISDIGLATYYSGNPYYFSAYVQDKMEYDWMIANFGVRFDGFNNNVPYYADRYNPFYQAKGTTMHGDPTTTMPETHTAVSPRLGVSFPISDRTAFHFQYGHFHAMPSFRYSLYRNTLYGWRYYGNPNIGFFKTISYEFGLQHSFRDIFRFDVVTFYNDRVNQMAVFWVHAPTGNNRDGQMYISYDNSGYGETKGIEITAENVANQKISYKLSYTLARSISGAYGSAEIWSEDPEDPRNFINERDANAYITGNDRTHKLRLYLTYRTRAKEGLRILGFYPFERTVLSVIYSVQSGRPYTYVTDFDKYLDVVNNERYPIEQQTDLKWNRQFMIGRRSAFIGLRVQNLFNNKWLTPIAGNDLKDWVEKHLTYDNPESTQYKFNYFRTYRNEPFHVYFNIGIDL